jgi:hypothetical protein
MSTNISHRWVLEQQRGDDDWTPAGLDSSMPITQETFDDWAGYPTTQGAKLRIIHVVTTTSVERTRVSPVTN